QRPKHFAAVKQPAVSRATLLILHKLMRDILKSFAKGGLRKLGYELVRQPAHQIKRNGVAPDIVIVGPYLLHNFGDDLIGAVLAKHMQERGRAVAIPNLGWKNAEWLQLIHSAKYERFGSR